MIPEGIFIAIDKELERLHSVFNESAADEQGDDHEWAKERIVYLQERLITLASPPFMIQSETSYNIDGV